CVTGPSVGTSGLAAPVVFIPPPLAGEGGRRSRPGGGLSLFLVVLTPPRRAARVDPPLKGRDDRDRPREVRAGGLRDAGAELLAQMPRADFLDRAVFELAELERTVGHANEPVHLQPEMLQHVAHLAVLALADRKGEPDIGALRAVERGLD